MFPFLEHPSLGCAASRLLLPRDGAAQVLALLRAILGAMGVTQADGALMLLTCVLRTEFAKRGGALAVLESIAELGLLAIHA